MQFNELGLQSGLLSAVSSLGYSEPTPIQAQAVPVILQGKDVLGGAQTGTGKTAAFALPILQLLNENPSREKRPRALVLCPTRELAAQVSKSFDDLGGHLRLRSAAVFGGVGMQPQVERLRRGVDILTACPGRLLDHVRQGTVDLRAVEILVLDEADRMLDMGFINDIRRVLGLMPQKRQNLLFSATYSKEIRDLSKSVLHAPAYIEVTDGTVAVDTIRQVVHPVSQQQKRALLTHLIKSGGWGRVLVFTRTKHAANRLEKQLSQEGIRAAAIHGNKSQSARTRALADFKSNQTQVLVATDIAARGVDIEGLAHVVNFELPNVPSDYIHRIGRTGRAGKTGEAVSLVSPDEQTLLFGIERLMGNRISSKRVSGFDADCPPSPRCVSEGVGERRAPGGRRENNREGSFRGRRENRGRNPSLREVEA